MTYFSEVFQKNGGFDVVIANPPYVQIKDITLPHKKAFEKQYDFATGRFNLFYLFIERSDFLSKIGGINAFIIPDRLLLNTQCRDIRYWLMNSNQIVEIISFGDQVFETAVVDSIVIIFQKIQNSVESIQARCKVLGAKITDTDQRKIPLSYFELSPTSQFDLNYTPEKYALLKKITNNSIFLEDISETRDGIIQSKIGEQLFIYSQKNEQCKKLLFGMDVNFYSISYRNRWVDYRPSEMGALEQIKGGSGLRLRNKAIFERKKFSRARPQIASSVLLMNLTIFTMEIHFMVLPLLIGITIQDIFWPFSIAKSQHGSIVQILTKVGKYLLRLKSNYYGKFLFQERMIRVSNI